jgi:CRP-like cAMP-binding protein
VRNFDKQRDALGWVARGIVLMTHGERATQVVADLGPMRWASELQAVGPRVSESTPLSQTDRNVLRSLRNRKEHGADAVLADDGVRTHGVPRFQLSGWACRQSILSDGRRQIFCFLIPGDIISATSKSLSLTSIVALTPGVTAEVLISEVANPRDASGSIYSKLIDAAEQETQELLHDQIVRLGRMNGLAAMAHLLLELQRRLSRVGLASGQTFPMPLRQEALADALGMSAVHVNRTLQQLRHNKLINCSGREVTILDAGRLTELADGLWPQRKPVGDAGGPHPLRGH